MTTPGNDTNTQRILTLPRTHQRPMASLVKHLVPRSDAHVTGALPCYPARVNTWAAFCQAAPPLKDPILPMPQPRNRLKRRVHETQALTRQGNRPLFPVPFCTVFVLLIAPLNSAGAETPGSAGRARSRSTSSGMFKAGRWREHETTAGVIGPAAVAVGRPKETWMASEGSMRRRSCATVASVRPC